MTDFFKGSVIYPAQASKSNYSAALPKGAVVSSFDAATPEAVKFLGLYYDSDRSEEYLFWADKTANIFTAPNTVFSWTRNDKYLTRFEYSSKNQKWSPIKGSTPIKLGVISEGSSFKLNPTLSEYKVGKKIYFDRFYVGDVPKVQLVAQVIYPVDNPPPYPEGVDIYINGSPDTTKGGGSVLSVNPKHAGKTLWYNPSSFQANSDGFIGFLPDQNLYISPIPAPTDTPLIRVGNRAYLKVELYSDTLPESWAEDTCYVNVVTGQLFLSSSLKSKHKTDKKYYNNPVYYDGIKMGDTSPLVITASNVTCIEKESFFGDTYSYQISINGNNPLKKDLNGKINVVNYLTYIHIDIPDKKITYTLRVDDDNKFDSSKEEATSEEIESFSKTDNYCFFNYVDNSFYVAENVAEDMEDENFRVTIYQICFTPLVKILQVGLESRVYSHDRKQIWTLSEDNSVVTKSAGEYSTEELVSNSNYFKNDRGYLYTTRDKLDKNTSHFTTASAYKPYSELGIIPLNFSEILDSGIHYTLDKQTLDQIAGNNFWVNSTLNEGTPADYAILTDSYKPSPALTLDFPPMQETSSPFSINYGPDKTELVEYTDFIPDYDTGRLLWGGYEPINNSESILRDHFSFDGSVFGPSVLVPFQDTSKVSSFRVKGTEEGAEEKLLFPSGYDIPSDLTLPYYSNIRYALNESKGIVNFSKSLGQIKCSGYDGSVDSTGKFSDLYVSISLDSNIKYYYLNISSGTNIGVYKLKSDLTFDTSTPFYNASDTGFSWQLYLAEDSQILVQEFSKNLNYVKKDPRLQAYIEQEFPAYVPSATPAPRNDWYTFYSKALKDILAVAFKYGREVSLGYKGLPSLPLKIISTTFAGFVGQPLPEPSLDVSIFVEGVQGTVDFDYIKNNISDLKGRKVFYISRGQDSDFYYEPISGFVNIPGQGTTANFIISIRQSLDLTNEADVTFNAGLGLVELKEALLEGQKLYLSYYESDAANTPTGDQLTVSSKTKSVTAPTKFFRPSFKVVKGASGLKDTVLLRGQFPDIKKGTLFILENSQVLRVGTDPSYDVSTDTTTITLSVNYSFEIGSRDLKKFFKLQYTNSLDNCHKESSSLTSFSRYGSRQISLVKNLSLYALENSIIEILPSEGPAAGKSFYHQVQSISDDGSIILKSPLALNFAANTTVNLYYTPIYESGVTSALWLTPNSDSLFLDTKLDTTSPYSLVLFDSVNVAGRVLRLNKDYSIAGKNITLNNGTSISEGQTLVFLHTRNCGLLPGVLFNGSAFKFKALDKAENLPIRVLYSYYFPDSYQSQIEPLAIFAGNLEPKLEANTTSPGTSGPTKTSGGSSKPSGVSHPRETRVLALAQDRAAREKLSYLNNTISNFEQILELLSGRFIGGVDGKFRSFTGKTLKYPILENYEEPVTGLIRPILFNTSDIDWDLNKVRDNILASVLSVRNDIDNYIVTGKKRKTHTWFGYAGGYNLVYKPLYKPSYYSRLFPTLVPVFAQTMTNGSAGYGYFDTNGSTIASLSNPVLGDITNIRGISNLFDRKPFAEIISATKDSSNIVLQVSFLEDSSAFNPDVTKNTPVTKDNFFSDNGPALFPSQSLLTQYMYAKKLLGSGLGAHEDNPGKAAFITFYTPKNQSGFSYSKRHLFEDAGVVPESDIHLKILDAKILKNSDGDIIGQEITVNPLIYREVDDKFGPSGVSASPVALLSDYACISYAISYGEGAFPIQTSSASFVEQGLGRRYRIGSDIDYDSGTGSLIDASILDVSPDNPGGHTIVSSSLNSGIFHYNSDCPPPGVSLKGIARVYNTRQTPVLLPALQGKFLDDSGQDSNKFMVPLLDFQDYFNTYYTSLSRLKDIADEEVVDSGVTIINNGYLQIESAKMPSNYNHDNSLLLAPTLALGSTLVNLSRYYLHEGNKIFFPAHGKNVDYFKLNNFITPTAGAGDVIEVARREQGTGASKTWTVDLTFLSQSHTWGDDSKFSTLLANSSNYFEIILDSSKNTKILLYKDHITYSTNTLTTPVSLPVKDITIQDPPSILTFTFGQPPNRTSDTDPISSLTPTQYSKYTISYICLGGSSGASFTQNHIFNLEKLEPWNFNTGTTTPTTLNLYSNPSTQDTSYSSVVLDNKLIVYKKNLSSTSSPIQVSFVPLTKWDNYTVTSTLNLSTRTIATNVDKLATDYYDEMCFYLSDDSTICTYETSKGTSTDSVSAAVFNQIPETTSVDTTNSTPLYRARRYSQLNNFIKGSLYSINSKCFEKVTVTLSAQGSEFKVTSSHAVISEVKYSNNPEALLGSYILSDGGIQVTVKSSRISNGELLLGFVAGGSVTQGTPVSFYLKKNSAPIKQSLEELEPDLFKNIGTPVTDLYTVKDDKGNIYLDILNKNITPQDWDYALVQTQHTQYLNSGDLERNYNFYSVDNNNSSLDKLALKSISYSNNYSENLVDIPGVQHTLILFKKNESTPEKFINYYFFWRVKAELLAVKQPVASNFDSSLTSLKVLNTKTDNTVYSSSYLNDDLLTWWGGFESQSPDPDSAEGLKALWASGPESSFYNLDVSALGSSRKERFRWITYRTHSSKGSLLKIL